MSDNKKYTDLYDIDDIYHLFDTSHSNPNFKDVWDYVPTAEIYKKMEEGMPWVENVKYNIKNKPLMKILFTVVEDVLEYYHISEYKYHAVDVMFVDDPFYGKPNTIRLCIREIDDEYSDLLIAPNWEVFFKHSINPEDPDTTVCYKNIDNETIITAEQLHSNKIQ